MLVKTFSATGVNPDKLTEEVDNEINKFIEKDRPLILSVAPAIGFVPKNHGSNVDLLIFSVTICFSKQ
jgi:hypothetical protein